MRYLTEAGLLKAKQYLGVFPFISGNVTVIDGDTDDDDEDNDHGDDNDGALMGSWVCASVN